MKEENCIVENVAVTTCEHERLKLTWKICDGNSICKHERKKSTFILMGLRGIKSAERKAAKICDPEGKIKW